MTWSLGIRGGDLSLAGVRGMATVEGHRKVLQDLRCWLLEHMGHDPLHPDYGSLLDGGIMPDGSIVETKIGNVINNELVAEVREEIYRILTAYQNQQQKRIKQEQDLYGGRTTYSDAEIVRDVADVQFRQVGDRLIVKIILVVGNGAQISIVQPVQ